MRKIITGILFFGLLMGVEIKIGNHDLNCSYTVLKNKPLASIVSSMDEDFKKQTFSEGDMIFARGELEPGKTYSLMGEVGSLSGGYKIYKLQGYGEVLRKEGDIYIMKVTSSCTGVKIGSKVFPPLVEKEFTVNIKPITLQTTAPAGTPGKIVFIESSFKQLGEGWAVVKGARALGLQRGDTVIVFGLVDKVKKPKAMGVVLRTAGDYAVVETLLPIDAIREGDLVYKK